MIFLWLNVLFGCICLMNCSTTAPKEHTKAKVKDLDSLNRIAEHKDSLESNTIFYEEAYQEYRKLFPGVDKSTYLHLAKGKDQELVKQLSKRMSHRGPIFACGEVWANFPLKKKIMKWVDII